jgi:hypothetical protein
MPSLAVVRPPHSVTPEGFAPEWLVAQMPAGYRNRYEEIQRLSSEIKGMDRLGRLLWESGAPLQEAVQEAFTAMKADTAWLEGGTVLSVSLDSGRRLLIHVAGSDGPLDRKSEALATAFRTLQEATGKDDRTVLLTSGERDVPPKDRGDTVTADAHDLLRRMGVNVLPASTLFNIWMLSLTELNEARTCLDLLHGQDGGAFKIKAGK